MKKAHIFQLSLSLILIFTLIFSGCSNNDDSSATAMKDEDIPTSTTVQQLTTDAIINDKKNAKNISYEDYKQIDNITCLAFSYEYKNQTYFGFSVATDDGDLKKLSYFESSPNSTEEAVWIAQFNGSYPNTENRVFHITIGYINDNQIEQVALYYPQSILKIINLAQEQQVFFDININSDDSLSKIECKDSSDNIVFEKDYLI